MTRATTAASPRMALAWVSAPAARSALAAWSLGAVAVAFLFVTRAAEQTRDSLLYAYAAKTGEDLFHPHHLLFTPAVRFIATLLALICDGCDAVLAGQLHNIAWTGVMVAIVYLLVSKITGHGLISLVASSALLVTRGNWELASQTTVYAPAAGTLALLAGALLLRSAGPFTLRSALASALLLALAVLYHQANVLFCLPLAYYLASRGGPGGWRLMLAILGLAGAVVLAVYVAAFLATGAPWSLDGFVAFCLSYTTQVCSGGQCDASPSRWGDVANLWTGFGTALGSLVWNYVFVPTWLRPIAAAVIGLGLLGLALWHGWRAARGAEWRALRLFLLLWLFGYGLFFWWWLPDYEHPFLLTVLPALLLACLALQDVRGRLVTAQPRRLALLGGLAGLVLALGTVNFSWSILPLMAARGDSYTEAEALSGAAPPACAFLTSYRVWNHLRYYFDRAEATQQAKYPLSYFYQGLALPPAYALRAAECIVVDAHFVTPGYVLTGYTPTPADGYTQPAAWLTYMAWLFGFEYDDNQQVTAARSFEVIGLEEGGPYLALTAETAPVAGLEDLFEQLDAALSGSADLEPGVFTAWLADGRVRP